MLERYLIQGEITLTWKAEGAPTPGMEGLDHPLVVVLHDT